jgi:hypothetical protein
MEKLAILLLLTLLSTKSNESNTKSPYITEVNHYAYNGLIEVKTIDGQRHLYKDLGLGSKWCYEHQITEKLEKRVDKK